MSTGALLVIAVGVAMDATAVAASRAAAAPRIGLRDVLLVAVLFGGFQAAMPLLGWMVGSRIGVLVAAWDHWIACTLLASIGVRMLWDAFAGGDADVRPDRRAFSPRVLLLLAIATSIDAFAVGITLPWLDAALATSLVVIGGTTAALSALGVLLGRWLGASVGRRLDAAGGIVLIGIGLRILVDHIRAG